MDVLQVMKSHDRIMACGLPVPFFVRGISGSD